MQEKGELPDIFPEEEDFEEEEDFDEEWYEEPEDEEDQKRAMVSYGNYVSGTYEARGV